MTLRKNVAPASVSGPADPIDPAGLAREDPVPRATSDIVNETKSAAQVNDRAFHNPVDIDHDFLNKFRDKMTQQQNQSALQTFVMEHQKRPVAQLHEKLSRAGEWQPGPARALPSEPERPVVQHQLVPATNPDPSASDAVSISSLPTRSAPSEATIPIPPEVPMPAKNCLNGLSFLYADFWDSLESETICKYVQHHGGRVAYTFDEEISYVILSHYHFPDILQYMFKAIDELKLKVIDIYLLDELMCHMPVDGGADSSLEPTRAREVADGYAGSILRNSTFCSTKAGSMDFYKPSTPRSRGVSYSMQLMLLEIKNKKMLREARLQKSEFKESPQAAWEALQSLKRQQRESTSSEAKPADITPPLSEEKHLFEGKPPSEEKPPSDAHLISTNLLIPGSGSPKAHMWVVLSSGTITHLFPMLDLPPSYRHLPVTAVRVLMPGMWDCHVHLIGATNLKFDEQIIVSPATAGARLAKSCNDILMSGFTSVRDLGGYAPEIAKAVNEGSIPGPNIYSAGAAISQTAGHGDIFELPIGWVWGRCGVGSGANGDDVACRPLCIADGLDECRKAVRLQIRRGASVIKVLASGGVLSRDDDPLFQQFSDEELTVMVQEANRFNRSVAAHVHGKAGILAAIRAGCATLEHGTYLDDECVDAMLEADVMLVATRTIVIEALKYRDLISPESYAKLVETAKWHKKAYELAIRRGVKCALGTDLALSVPGEEGSGLNLGRSGGEVKHAVEAGMTPLKAIEAVTANGPLTLGKMAPRKGRVEVGWDADLIGVDGDVLKDVGVLADVDKITHVWKGGKLVKERKMPIKA